MIERKLIFIVVLLFGLISCEKNELPENNTSEDVTFYTEGQVDGAEFFLSAGPENVVVTSESELEEGEIGTFHVSFENSECENCTEEIHFLLSSSEEYTEAVEFSELLPLGNYSPNYLETTPGDHNLFSFSLNGDNMEFFEVMDENEEIINSGLDMVELEAGQYSYNTFSFGNEGDCLVGVSGAFSVLDEGNICFYQIYYEEIGNSGFLDFSDFDSEFTIVLLNGEDVSGTFVTTELIPIEELSLDGIFSLSVAQFDANQEGCISYIEYTISEDFSWECLPEFQVNSESTLESVIQAQAFSIEYVNEQGENFISSLSSSGELTIESVEFYPNDPFNREAYRIGISGEILLVNETNSSEEIVLNINEAYLPIVIE